jgi:hypothetical protein
MKDWMKERMEFSERFRANQREQAELAFDQYEFDAKVEITLANYDLVRQVFIDAFIKGREST